MTALLRSYRLGHAATTRHLNAILANHVADAEELNLATDLCSAWMFAYVDTALCLAEDVYTTERERWLRSAAASQAETINTILSGTTHRYRRGELGGCATNCAGTHVAAVAWLDTHEEGRHRWACSKPRFATSPRRSATSDPSFSPWAYCRSRPGSAPTATCPPGSLTSCGSAPRQHPVSGSRSANPRRASRVFAPAISRHSQAQRIARLAGRRESSITRYNDIAVRALATADLEQARRFVERELGRLAAPDDTTRRLAATVRAYLDENGSRGRTAKRLHIHENTVAYRLRQAEELLGRSVEKRTLELRVALSLTELVDDAPDTNSPTPAAE